VAAERLHNQLTPAVLRALDMLWAYREGIAVVIGLILLVMIVDNISAVHKELAQMHRTLEAMAKRTEGRQLSSKPESFTRDSGEWRAD
jgi:hypothetical protein